MMLSSLSAQSPESVGTPLEEEREKMFIHSSERGVRECFPKCEAIRELCVCVCVCEREAAAQAATVTLSLPHSLHILSPLFTFLESAAVRSVISYRCGPLAL